MVSIVVPSYRRPELLANCLRGLAAQDTQPSQVIVARRVGDEGTAKVIAASPVQTTEVAVELPGVLAALHAGVAAATGEIVAFTDDDAVPRPNWLSVLLQHYEDPSVVGVGGRDVVPTERTSSMPSVRVGCVGSWGRTTDGHHLGFGPASEVALLKGVNMSFRRDALALPERLRGTGAQVHYEMYASLWAAVATGGHLIYDPAALVDHYVGPRFDADGRTCRASTTVADEAFNLVYALVGVGQQPLWRRAAFGLLVGDRATPGLFRALVAAARGEDDVVAHLGPSLRGQTAALLSLIRGDRPKMLPATNERAETPPSIG